MLGFHVNKTISKGGRKKTRDMATAMKTDIGVVRNWGFAKPAAQIFVTGPRDFHKSITPEDATAIRRIVEDEAVVVIHGAYVDNPWSLSPGAVHNIKQEMIIAHEIGATGVIVHLAAGASSYDSLGQVLHDIATLPDAVKASATLWLEIHTAKSSPATYETVEKITRLFERIGVLGLNGLRVGLCIDTAHLFACGMALDTYDKAKNWIAGLPRVPIMMHLNDSESSLGSGIDKHERLCCGYLWGEYHPDDGILPFATSGLAYLLEWAESNNIVTILERDYDGADEDLALIHRMGYFQN